MKKQNLDALQQLRETSILEDNVQAQLVKERKAAIELAKKLYPTQVAAGVEFEHKGEWYIIKKTNKKWDFTHVTIDPIFNELRAAEAELAAAKKEHERLLKDVHKRFPHLKPKSYTETINVVRQKKADKSIQRKQIV